MKNSGINRRELLRTGAGAGAGLLLAGGAKGALGAPGQALNPVMVNAAPPPSDTGGDLSIAAFGGDAENKMFGAAVERFKKKYPKANVKLNISAVASWGDYANKLTTQIAGGKVPDVIEIAIEGTRLFVSKGLMEPLDDYVKGDTAAQTLISDIAKPLLDGLSVDGKLYQIPQNWNNMVIYYNTKLFAAAKLEPPKADWTWDDFLSAAKTLTTGEGKNKVYGLAVPWGGIFQLMPWWLTNGTYPLNADLTESNLSDPKIIEAITFIHDLIHVHKVAPSVQGTQADQLFAAGKVAMSGWGRWVMATLIGAKMKDFDIQYWPRKTAATSVFGVGGFGMSPHSKNKALTWELIKELSSKEVAQDVVTNGSAIPCLESAAKDPAFLATPPNAEIFYASLKDSKPVANPANFNQFEQIVIRHVGDILSGGTSPEDGMKAADKEVADAMKQLKS
jgi:multiple sugar transport system substrate-binding protein